MDSVSLFYFVRYRLYSFADTFSIDTT